MLMLKIIKNRVEYMKRIVEKMKRLIVIKELKEEDIWRKE